MKIIEKSIKLDSSKIIINSEVLKIDNAQRKIDKKSEQLNDKWNNRLSNFFCISLAYIVFNLYGCILYSFFSMKNFKLTLALFINAVFFVLVEVIYFVANKKINKRYTYTHAETEYNILSEIIDVWKDIRKSLGDDHAIFFIERTKKKFYLSVSYIDNKNCLVKRRFALMDSIKFYDDKSGSADESMQISFYNSKNICWKPYIAERYVEVFFPKSFYSQIVNDFMEKNIF